LVTSAKNSLKLTFNLSELVLEDYFGRGLCQFSKGIYKQN
jgi:hypothetical protein